MKLDGDREILTTKDLARWIAWDASETSFQKAHRQIRHWTQSDLLRTVSEKGTGKGVPRFYEEEPTFQIAAILMEMCRYIQSIDVLRYVSEALYDDADEHGGFGMYLSGSLTDLNVYMQVSWEMDDQLSSIVKANVRLWDDMDQEEEFKFDPSFSSSVVINLSNVMGRVYTNKHAEEPDGREEVSDSETPDE